MVYLQLISMYRPYNVTPSRQIAYFCSNLDDETRSTALPLRRQLVHNIVNTKQYKNAMSVQ